MKRNSLTKLAVLLVSVVVLLVLVMVACSSSEDEGDAAAPAAAPQAVAAPTTAAPAAPAVQEEKPRSGGTLRLGIPEPNSFDPQATWSVVAGNIAGMYGDVLVSRHPETYEFLPGGLATSWEVSEDMLTWTFKLKDDISYHDGEPFDAEAMAASYRHGADVGWVPKIYLPPEANIFAQDASTFVIQSPKIYGPMLDHISWPAWFIATAEHHRAVVGEEDYGTQPIGTGAFKFDQWIRGDSASMSRNEDYDWGPAFYSNRGAPYVEGISIKFIEEEATLNAAVLAQEIDVVYVPNQFAADLRKDDRFHFFTRESGRLSALSMNHESAPLDDDTVRKALMVAVDRDRIIQVMEQGEGFPQFGQVVRALPFYDQAFEDESAKLNAYNQDRAIALLAEAGWEKGSDGILTKDGEALEFNFIQTGSERNVRMGSLLQAQLQEIGITVNLETLESATHGSRRKEGNFDLRHSGYATLTADILSFFWHPTQSSNLDRISDQKFADLLDGARHSLGQERADANHEVQKYFRNMAMVIPLINPNSNTLVNKRVEGFIAHRNSMDWKVNDAWIRE